MWKNDDTIGYYENNCKFIKILFLKKCKKSVKRKKILIGWQNLKK